LPEEIGLLSNLKVLSLSGNQLSSLPKSISKLEKLQVLDVSNNRLTDKVVDDIGKLPSLREIKLSNNLLSVFPDGLLNCDVWRKSIINNRSKKMTISIDVNQYKISVESYRIR